MSMIIERVKELRRAGDIRLYTGGICIPEMSKLFNQAADTIEALSAKLKAKEYCDGCPGADIIEIPCTEECKRRHFKAENMQRSAADCVGGWIPCKDRLPTKEECIKSDCRFIVSDGNRVHQGIFDYDINHFVWFNCNGTQIDEVSIAWMPLPEPYHEP
ncbi:MAG: DUF551 domain-containing protein [Lachnospiraceae bacterium]|nr:DUF551 domain-containing protein [Lachnospiraceae bacterium]